MTKTVKPFGLWPSPLPAEAVAGQAVRFSRIEIIGGAILWSELRPYEQGRTAIMRQTLAPSPPDAPAALAEDLLPLPFSVRSRIHEYGGGEFLAIADPLHGDLIYFVNDSDQDVWRLDGGAAPTRITDAPGVRFGDFTFDKTRNRLISVAERHNPVLPTDRPENLLHVIDPGKSPERANHPLIAGRDFYACPRISPDGGRLAWLAWDLPHMPWEAAALYVAELDAAGEPGAPQLVAGGGGDSGAAFQPEWREDGVLVFVWDKTGWGNLYAWDGSASSSEPLAPKPLAPMDAEFGMPMWSLNARSFALLPEGRIAVAAIIKGEPTLGVVDPSGKFEPMGTDLRSITMLTADGAGVVVIAGRDYAPPAIIRVGLAGGQQTLRESATVALETGDISVARPLSFPADDGTQIHGLYYPPQNSRFTGPADLPPPLVMGVHGGPHSQAQRGLRLSFQYWTTRGFAFFDVDYSGSTGYGRAYRARLDGQWGVRDVADVGAAARFLARQGLADRERIVITGGSAGGYTVLMALANLTEFAAGAVYYGVSDLAALQRSTHKYEAGYLFNLLGVQPGPGGYSDTSHPVFRERSPLYRAGNIQCPVILFQGVDDKVTPPEQSRAITDELERGGVPVVLHEFENEAHGFRRAETVSKALSEEYAFYRWALELEK